MFAVAFATGTIWLIDWWNAPLNHITGPLALPWFSRPAGSPPAAGFQPMICTR